MVHVLYQVHRWENGWDVPQVADGLVCCRWSLWNNHVLGSWFLKLLFQKARQNERVQFHAFASEPQHQGFLDQRSRAFFPPCPNPLPLDSFHRRPPGCPVKDRHGQTWHSRHAGASRELGKSFTKRGWLLQMEPEGVLSTDRQEAWIFVMLQDKLNCVTGRRRHSELKHPREGVHSTVLASFTLWWHRPKLRYVHSSV